MFVPRNQGVFQHPARACIPPIRPHHAGMNSIDLTKLAEEEGRGFQFPGEFEVSAMGAADAELAALMRPALQEAGLNCIAGVERVRASSRGSYVSVTLAFRAERREDYDTAHRVLRALPEVKWTL